MVGTLGGLDAKYAYTELASSLRASLSVGVWCGGGGGNGETNI